MAESYDELKKENEKLKQERDKDRKIMHALKDQVDKLKLINKARRTGDDEALIKERDKEVEELKRELAKEKERYEEMVRKT